MSKTKIKYTYITNLVFYSIGGVLVNYWFWTAFFDPNGYGIEWGLARGMVILGIGASLLFLHLSYLSKKIIFEGRFLR
ncbi:hypothetical protein FLK61_24730 [Paenalkalicoccus suaedae]|uniref:Uncharacterized protein n=1 Tax=Paenalkalicoccus suaedae TaxID=2592382 RepID=A0A859FBS2_9BACI|nr:hypothetical protein FLK61_24730 [Paenalkalicoccus suaedae]